MEQKSCTGTGVLSALELIEALIVHYGIRSLDALLSSAKTTVVSEQLTIAVVGRFKVGKSSFLNTFFRREVLPVGVVPVTAIVTAIMYGPRERVRVRFASGRVEEIPVHELRSYVTEAANPENRKGVAQVSVELPCLERFRSATFVDTPGLESALLHNSEASRAWLPNIGMALVAIGVDPPLSKTDVDLVKRLYEFTPHVNILLTKADLVTPGEVAEIQAFMTTQLEKQLGRTSPPIYPYSLRKGYEDLRERFERDVIFASLSSFEETKSAVVRRKTESLLHECGACVAVALRAAESLESEQAKLRGFLEEERKHLQQFREQLRLLTKSAAAAVRPYVERALREHLVAIDDVLSRRLVEQFPLWAGSLNSALQGFENWLATTIPTTMLDVSDEHAIEFARYADGLGDQLAYSGDADHDSGMMPIRLPGPC